MIESFLKERTFNLSINGSISPSTAAVGGVPQGFVLFLIYVNDLPGLLHGDVLLFADDVKLISVRASFDDLQHDLYTA